MIIKTVSKQIKKANQSKVKSSISAPAVREDRGIVYPWESNDGLFHFNLNGHRQTVFA